MLSDISMIKHAKNLCCAHLGFLRLFLLLLVLFWSFWLWWLCFFGSARATTKPRMQSREKTWTKRYEMIRVTWIAYTRGHLSNSRKLWGENHPAHCQKAQKLLLSCQLQCLGLVWPSKLCALTSFALFSCWYQSFTRTAMSPSKNIRPSVGFGSVLLDLRFEQATPQTIVRTFKNVWCQNHLGTWWELINLKKQHHEIWQFLEILEDHRNALGHSWPFQCRICADMRPLDGFGKACGLWE